MVSSLSAAFRLHGPEFTRHTLLRKLRRPKICISDIKDNLKTKIATRLKNEAFGGFCWSISCTRHLDKMISQITHYLSYAFERVPAASFLALSLCLTALLLAVVAKYFEPVGKRRFRDGRKPHLPPGPPGLPIIGSLHKLKEARGDPDHKYVGFLLSTIERLCRLSLL